MNGLVPLDGFYHYGLVVRDFDDALDELGSNLGLEWASVQHRTFARPAFDLSRVERCFGAVDLDAMNLVQVRVDQRVEEPVCASLPGYEQVLDEK